MFQNFPLIVWRDSVCLADDCDAPHEITLSVPKTTLFEVANGLLEANYLASIVGGRATWILYAGSEKGQPLAVLAQQWSEPRFLVESETSLFTYVERTAHPHLFVRYWCQVDPEIVLECLRQSKPLPDQYGRS